MPRYSDIGCKSKRPTCTNKRSKLAMVHNSQPVPTSGQNCCTISQHADGNSSIVALLAIIKITSHVIVNAIGAHAPTRIILHPIQHPFRVRG